MPETAISLIVFVPHVNPQKARPSGSYGVGLPVALADGRHIPL
jgi:hypothetical protein